jgi:hypothetical protein
VSTCVGTHWIPNETQILNDLLMLVIQIRE